MRSRRRHRSLAPATPAVVVVGLSLLGAPGAPAVARADAAARPALVTSDADGVSVNRVAVRARRARGDLEIDVFLAARSLSPAARQLEVGIATCGRTGGSCVVRAGRPVVIEDAETRVRRRSRVPIPPVDGTVRVTLGASSLRVVLPSTAWRTRSPSWYGLKTPSGLWGSTTFRSVRVLGTPHRDGTMDVTMRTALDLDLGGGAVPAPQPTGLLAAALGTLDALGRWVLGDPGAASVVAAGDGLIRSTARARVGPPYGQRGFGMHATRDGEPLMVVWLPPPR